MHVANILGFLSTCQIFFTLWSKWDKNKQVKIFINELTFSFLRVKINNI